MYRHDSVHSWFCSEHGADDGVAAGEDAHHVGPAPDLLIQPLDPALPAGASRWEFGWSAFESGEVVGESVGNAGVASGFAVPAAGLGVSLQVLDVGELAADSVGEFGPGDEVVAGLADVGVGQAPAASWREQQPCAMRVLSISLFSQLTLSGMMGLPIRRP